MKPTSAAAIDMRVNAIAFSLIAWVNDSGVGIGDKEALDLTLEYMSDENGAIVSGGTSLFQFMYVCT